MATYTYDLDDLKALKYNSGTVTCESDEQSLYSSNYGSIKAKAIARGWYDGGLGKYQVGWAAIFIKVYGFSSGVTTAMSLTNTSGTPSGFTYPKGTSFTASSVNSNSWVTIVSGDNLKDIAGYISAGTVNVDVTINTTLNFTLVSGTTTVSNAYTLKGKLTFKAYNAGLTITYYRSDYEGGAQYGSPVSTFYNYPTTIKSGYNYGPTTNRGSGKYTVAYDSRGGTHVDSVERAWSYSQSVSYTFSKWGSYAPGASVKFTSNENLKASFIANAGTANYTYNNLNYLPTVFKKGYNSTNVWYYPGGGIASLTDKVMSSTTLYVEWASPKTYNIKFNLNEGKLPDPTDRVSNYNTSKTYGVSGPSIIIPSPTKVGWRFIGWGDKNGNYVQQPGEVINDNIYNAENDEKSNKDVTFYAKWELNPNTVKFNYFYNEQDSDPSHDIHITDESAQFNVTQTTFEYYAPEHTRTGDFVFLGWSDVVPTEWDKPEKVNEGYHGVYNIPPQKIIDVHGVQSNIELPLKLDIKKFKTLEDWGNTYTYYGIWAKTGKYIKVGNEWKKVSNAYVRVNGEWKPITGMWAYVNDQWKEEV